MRTRRLSQVSLPNRKSRRQTTSDLSVPIRVGGRDKSIPIDRKATKATFQSYKGRWPSARDDGGSYTEVVSHEFHTPGLAWFLGWLRYRRGDGKVKGYRHGHRDRRITGTFRTGTAVVPRARIRDADGGVREWRSRALGRYRRVTKKGGAPFTSVYLSGTNTRRVFALFRGAVSKDVVSRAWRRVRSDRDAWCARSLAMGTSSA